MPFVSIKRKQVSGEALEKLTVPKSHAIASSRISETQLPIA